MRRFFSFMWFRLSLLSLLFLSYFGSLWLAAAHFPNGYDWRRNVISNLLSPRDNPQWYWAPSAGVAVAGVCMGMLIVWMEGELGDGADKLARRVRRPAFGIGTGCLILSAVVTPQHTHLVMGMRHAHEALARASAAGLGVGTLCACESRALARGRRRRALRVLWRVATAPTIAGALGSGVAVRLGGAGYFRETVFWHLAFWEWIGSAAVFLFFASAVGLLGEA